MTNSKSAKFVIVTHQSLWGDVWDNSAGRLVQLRRLQRKYEMAFRPRLLCGRSALAKTVRDKVTVTPEISAGGNPPQRGGIAARNGFRAIKCFGRARVFGRRFFAWLQLSGYLGIGCVSDWVGRIERETVLNNSGSRLFEVGFTVASSFHDGEVGEESRDGVNVFTESA